MDANLPKIRRKCQALPAVPTQPFDRAIATCAVLSFSTAGEKLTLCNFLSALAIIALKIRQFADNLLDG